MKGGRIVAAGSRAEVEPLASATTQTIAVPGVAVPGWADAHVHSADTRGQGEAGDPLNLRGLTKPQILERIGALARSAPTGGTISGGGWDEGFFQPPVFPTAADLDAVSAGHPVILSRIDGHSSWVNSLVLKQSAITRSTPDPPGGRVVRGAGGEPTGLLVDRAQSLIRRGNPARGNAASGALERTRATLQSYASLGYTSIHPAGVDIATIANYKTLLEGGLPIRVYAMARGDATVRRYLRRALRWATATGSSSSEASSSSSMARSARVVPNCRTRTPTPRARAGSP